MVRDEIWVLFFPLWAPETENQYIVCLECFRRTYGRDLTLDDFIPRDLPGNSWINQNTLDAINNGEDVSREYLKWLKEQ